MKSVILCKVILLCSLVLLHIGCSGGSDSASPSGAYDTQKASQSVTDNTGQVAFTSAEGTQAVFRVVDSVDGSAVPSVTASFQQFKNNTLISSFKFKDYLPAFNIGEVDINSTQKLTGLESSDQATIISAIPLVGFVDKLGSHLDGVTYLEKIGGDVDKWGGLGGSTCMTVSYYNTFVSKFLTPRDTIGAIMDIGSFLVHTPTGKSILVGLGQNFILNSDSDKLEYFTSSFYKAGLIDTYSNDGIVKVQYYVNNNPTFLAATTQIPLPIIQVFHADDTCPHIAQAPLSGIPGTTFNQSGGGFTPNTNANLKVKKPDGSVDALSQKVNEKGEFNIDYKSDKAKPVGKYSWWVEDGVTGTPSNVINYVIVTDTKINPTIAQTPMSGPGGTIFKQWGTGFTPNSTATLYVQKPDGSQYDPQNQPIDSNGTFSIDYPSNTSKAAGSYKWWVKDSSGLTSNTITYTINLNPAIAQTPMSGPGGTIFKQWGTGFTPNSTAILFVQKPDRSQYDPQNQPIDSNGTFSIDYPSNTSKAAGSYKWWVKDSSGLTSNTVTYTISLNPTIAQTPMSGPAGTSFKQWGTGFTPNSTAIVHVQKPDGSLYDPQNQPIDSNGTFSINYASSTTKPSGTYKWWVNDTSGLRSNTVSYHIQ